MKKRVAIIIPGGIGGGYFLQGIPVLEDLVQRLSVSFDVTVYSLIKTDPAYKPKNFVLRHTGAPRSRPVMWRIFLCSMLFIKDHFTKKYQMIHGVWGHPPGRMAVLLGKLFRIPSVVSIRGGEAAHVPEINYGNMLHPRIRKITLRTCRDAGALTALTMFQIKQLQKFGLARQDFHIIPNGVDPAIFSQNKKPLKAPFHFIHIANLTWVKDQATLMRAFKLVAEKADCQLTMIGDGECRADLEKLADDLDIRAKVIFTGAIQNTKLPDYLHKAHIMLHGSLYEGQGVVLAEAAACGVVVCGTRVGLISDWGEACCIPVDCGDFESMAARVLALLANAEQYEQLQQNAYAWAMKNTAADMAASFQKLYIQMMPS